MAGTCLHALVVVLMCCASLAAASPCIECKDCQGMQSCYQVCVQTCPKAPALDPAACKDYGHHAANSAAQKACNLAMDYCGGPTTQAHPTASSAATSPHSAALVTCANIAFASCQAKAMDPASTPCGQHFQGYKQCNGKQFVTFYAGIVNDACRLSSNMIEQGLVVPAPSTPTPVQQPSSSTTIPIMSVTTPVGSVAVTETVKVGGRKLAQTTSQVIIKNPTTVGPKGATASSIQRVDVPAGAQAIVPGQPTLVQPGQPQLIVPGQPQILQPVVYPGQVQPVVYPGQPQVIYPGQPQVIYPAGH